MKGHLGDSLGYLSAIRDADSVVNQTWHLLQSDPFYKDKTTFIVTCDHGRHTTNYKTHGGDGCDGCRHCILLILGPDTKAGIVDATRYRQIDIAPTIGRLLGFSLPYSTGKIIESACPPLAPLLVSPSDNATNISVDPTVAWNKVSDNATYRLQVSAPADFSSALVDRASVTDTVLAVGRLAFNTRYSWRVKGVSDGGASDWSTVRTFTTIPESLYAPAVPSLVSPVNDTNGQTPSPVLLWNAAARAMTYELQIARDSGFSNPVVQAGEVASTTYHANSLADNTVYLWRVRAKNADTMSQWSPLWKFITLPGVGSIPTAVAPPNRAEDQPAVTALSWRTGSGALSYCVQVSGRSDFSTTDTAQAGIIDTFFILTGLANQNTYYWRVKATTLGGSTGWSQDSSFTTVIAAPDSPLLWAPADSALSQSLSLTSIGSRRPVRQPTRCKSPVTPDFPIQSHIPNS